MRITTTTYRHNNRLKAQVGAYRQIEKHTPLGIRRGGHVVAADKNTNRNPEKKQKPYPVQTDETSRRTCSEPKVHVCPCRARNLNSASGKLLRNLKSASVVDICIENKIRAFGQCIRGYVFGLFGGCPRLHVQPAQGFCGRTFSVCSGRGCAISIEIR